MPSALSLSCLILIVSCVKAIKPLIGNHSQSVKYKPVLLMHGIDGTCKDFEHVIPWLQKSHPGTLTYCIPKFEGTPMSWIALPLQIPSIIKNITNYIAQNPADFEDGYHLVCHSQGGLICRAITEMMDDHKIHTLVSLAGPQLGVWGKDFFNGIRIPIFENLTRDQIYRLAYLPEAQATLSVANMWNDPAHFSLYEESSKNVCVKGE